MSRFSPSPIVIPNARKVADILYNPLVPTKVKFIGDSITAGVGGTGYSATGEDISSTGFKSNVLTATSWANMLYNHINKRIAKKQYIIPGDKAIANSTTGAAATILEESTLNTLQWRYRMYNYNAQTKGLLLRFYGAAIDVLYQKRSASGILQVKVDGANHGYIDAYDASASYGNVYAVTGLSAGYHTIEIIETGTKNASSTDTVTFIEGFAVTKSVTFKNWGISGKDSAYYYTNKALLVEPDDNILIMQLGTNDRKYNSPEVLKTYQRLIIQYAKSLGITVILMSSIPASVSDDNTETRITKMDQIDQSIRQLAVEMNLPFISNYDWFIQYTTISGATLASLLSDGLHPNDLGYKLMFQNIARNLGLSIIQDGIN